MQETAARADEDLCSVGEPLGFEERQHFCIQQCVARIEAIMAAEFARELDTGNCYFRLFFHM